MGWTDTTDALALAGEELRRESNPAERPTILPLTDGRPATEATQTSEAMAAYSAALRDQLRRLAEDGVVVHVIPVAADPAELAKVEPW
ncbi:MAG: hypothetical protein M5U01_26725 [Ardenticatenaceae bacterium]|nr:hypothetical protein [Ardenticatenaceae bacterium]HBY93745.1 hypothetical protein [Chloroflexota bacterium]